jgi:thymidylate kinase
VRPSSAPAAQQLVVAEIVGPAGAGKSTLFELLLAEGHGVRAPKLGRSRRTPLLAWHAASALGSVLRYRALRGMTPERLLAMAYVQALAVALGQVRPDGGPAVLLDQGPVYFLSRPFATRPRLRLWRERWLLVWRARLHLVVWLDAPDEVLAERIRSREKDHALKQSPDTVTHVVLGESRSAYEDALSSLAADVELLRFDTSAATPDEIAAAVIPRLGGAAGRADVAPAR